MIWRGSPSYRNRRCVLPRKQILLLATCSALRQKKFCAFTAPAGRRAVLSCLVLDETTGAALPMRTRASCGGREFGPSRLVQYQTRQRSEEHTSELQSPCNLVCRLLLEKKKNI